MGGQYSLGVVRELMNELEAVAYMHAAATHMSGVLSGRVLLRVGFIANKGALVLPDGFDMVYSFALDFGDALYIYSTLEPRIVMLAGETPDALKLVRFLRDGQITWCQKPAQQTRPIRVAGNQTVN